MEWYLGETYGKAGLLCVRKRFELFLILSIGAMNNKEMTL